MPIYRSTVIFYGAKILNEKRLWELHNEYETKGFGSFELEYAGIDGVDLFYWSVVGSPVYIYSKEYWTEICDLSDDNPPEWIQPAEKWTPPVSYEVTDNIVNAAKQLGLEIEPPTWWIGHNVTD